MSADREKDIFFAAAELPMSERAAFLAEQCGGDAAMLGRINTLLGAHERAEEFMAAPTIDPEPAPAAPRPDRELTLGAVIGTYTLDSLLGEGGFGRVYLATQREPVSREVAFKVLKAGMDSHAIVARFEAERQALAVMDHPNVAHVFDGGETESGRPYFAMEYVRGVPITDYCSNNRLGLRQRLELFERVCLAVQHAHQKGIIHRDLKPTNVLVATVDGEPVPKVIDFGIAKALGAEAAGATMLTAEGHMIGTPAYMSPEQASGSAVMDTRSDVYTLGVLLYEVLTGLQPFEQSRLESVPLAGLAKIICEESPPRPSTRVTKAGSAANATPAPRLRGDLDWIVMRAMEKEPERRYQTALALAADIRRYLRDEAVEAGPPSGVYRLRKFASRHRGELLAAGLVFTALVAGLVSSLVFIAQLDEQARLTARELEKAESFAGFASGMLSGLDPAVARGEDTVLLKQMLADARAGLEASPPDSGETEAEMHELLGTAYTKLAAFDEAEREFADALEHAIETTGEESELALRIRHGLGNALVESTEFDRGREELGAVYAARVKTLRPDHPDTIKALFDIAVIDRLTGQDERAGETFSQIVARREAVLGSEHEDTMSARNSLAVVLDNLGEHAEAAALFEQVIEFQTRELGPEHPHTLATRNNYTDALFDLGRKDEALATLRELLEIKRRILEPDHPSLVVALNNLASTERDMGDPDRAEALYGEASETAARAFGPRDMRTLILANNHARLMLQTGRAADAATKLGAAIPISEEEMGPEHPLTLAMLSILVGAQLETGATAGAVETARTLVDRTDSSRPADHADRANNRRVLGEALLRDGDAAGAEAVLVGAYAMHERGMVRTPTDIPQTAALLAEACEALGKPDDAERWATLAAR